MYCADSAPAEDVREAPACQRRGMDRAESAAYEDVAQDSRAIRERRRAHRAAPRAKP